MIRDQAPIHASAQLQAIGAYGRRTPDLSEPISNSNEGRTFMKLAV